MVLDAFSLLDAPSLLIVYVGQRAECVLNKLLCCVRITISPPSWKGQQQNVFRGDPWNVSSVPTLVRTRDVRVPPGGPRLL